MDIMVGVPVNNQIDAQLFFCKFQFCTCFEQPRAHHQENQLYQYNIWYVSLCVGDRLVCRSWSSFPTCMMSTGLLETCKSSPVTGLDGLEGE
jgi:hypothetical protein